ncbi:hypothetical protein U1Q18_041964 [Sarracenia purpurea var. burkii]
MALPLPSVGDFCSSLREIWSVVPHFFASLLVVVPGFLAWFLLDGMGAPSFVIAICAAVSLLVVLARGYAN